MIHEKSIFVSSRDLNIPMAELYRSMGYGSVTPDEDICALAAELLDQALDIAKPSYYYQIFDNPLIDGDKMRVDTTEFVSGKTINGLLRRSSRVALFVATAGEEFQQWMEERASKDEMLNTFIIDAIGSTIVEATGDYMERMLERELSECEVAMKHTNRFSPGYCGWWIEEQKIFFAMLPKDICGITLNDSSLMHPLKSISGVIGIGEDVMTKKYGCSICKRLDCYMRR